MSIMEFFISKKQKDNDKEYEKYVEYKERETLFEDIRYQRMLSDLREEKVQTIKEIAK